MPTCPNCGTDNPDGFRFCGQCGTPLAETTPERLEALNDEFEGRFGARIGLRVGINTGEVLAGDAGGGEGFVSGDAVNVAARLEQTAGVGEVLLGELTYRLARQAITAERVEPLTLKGKAKPVPAYRLVAVAPDGAARVGHAGTALVGREEELAALEQEFDAAVAAAGCRLITILGEPGIGKSRLVLELLASVEPEARVLTGRCLSYGEGITYWALGEIVRRAAGIEKEDDPATARRRIESLLAGTEDAEAVAALIAQALGLERGSGATGEIAWAARRLFEALARERPLVVAIEDLHWAEQALVDLVEQLPALARGPILVVCLGRPEALDARPEWPGRVIRLEDGLVRQTPDGRWAPHGSLADFAIPPTIDALLAERLDRLEARQRTLLEDGAVEGQLFHLGAVLALAAESADRAARLLAELVQRELVRPSTPAFVDETAYRFRHILIRDAAYRALPKKTRGELHEQYARWLEQKAGGRETEYEEILGYHFEQAYHYRLELGLADDAARELGLRAGRLLAAAGRRALGRSDMAAAEGLLSRAVELLPADDPDRIERLLGLSVALRDLGAFERAAEVNAEAMERAAAVGLRGVEARGRLNGGLLRLCPDPVEEALERCAELVERGTRGTAALVNAYAASLEAMRGQFDAGRQKAELSHSMLQDLGRRMTAAGMCYFRAEVELLAGEPARAEEIARPALDTLNALAETANSAALGALLAEALVRQGRFDEAVALTETSERAAWPDDLHAQVGWRATRAQALAGRGEAARGEELAREALAMLDGADDL